MKTKLKDVEFETGSKEAKESIKKLSTLAGIISLGGDSIEDSEASSIEDDRKTPSRS